MGAREAALEGLELTAGTGGRAPEIAVVVPSRDRSLRLRWLLNALEGQTLEQPRFEVLVVHAAVGTETDALLRAHPLAASGVLRRVRLPPGASGPGAYRNAGLAEVRSPLVAFTGEECRPPPDWLERALAAARRRPGAIVQGRTIPDPEEEHLLQAVPWSRTEDIAPPVPWAQACNVVYPRELLERAGGFDAELPCGDDADAAERCRGLGAPYVAAPEVLTYHGVEAPCLPVRLRGAWRRQHLPALVRRHPGLRRALAMRVFREGRHGRLLLFVAGGVGLRTRRGPLSLLLLLPYAADVVARSGPGRRNRAYALLRLPGQAALDATEMIALARGSARHRTLVL